MFSSKRPFAGLLTCRKRPQGALSGKEVSSAAHVRQQALDSNEDVVHGPLSAVCSAFKELGRAMHVAGSALEVVSTSETAHLSFTSLREVVRKE